MAQPALLGIDAGTTACKAAVFALDGELLAVGRAGYPVYRHEGGVVEQAPAEWWDGVREAVSAALAELPVGYELAAVGSSGTMPTQVFVASDGTVAERAMIWLDARAVEEAVWMEEHVGAERLEQATGASLPIAPTMPPARLRWFARHRPELLAGGHRMVQTTKDFVNYRLTAELATDHVSNLGLVDVRTRRPDPEYLALLGVPLSLLPPAFEPFELVGRVTTEASRETGLPVGLPVVCGWLDSFCTMLGTGLGAAGVAFDIAGTSEMVGAAGPSLEQTPGILVLPLYEGLSVAYGVTNAGADSLSWFCRGFGVADDGDPAVALARLAEATVPGAGGLVFLPYLGGERAPIWDADASGVFFGCRPEHGLAHFARAVVEGVAYCVRQLLALSRAAGSDFEVVRTSGGGARSRFVNQVKADVLGLPVVAVEGLETGARGAAMLAAIGIGLCDGYADAVARMTREGERFDPRPEAATAYDQQYAVYEALYPALASVYARAATEPRVA